MNLSEVKTKEFSMYDLSCALLVINVIECVGMSLILVLIVFGGF